MKDRRPQNGGNVIDFSKFKKNETHILGSTFRKSYIDGWNLYNNEVMASQMAGNMFIVNEDFYEKLKKIVDARYADEVMFCLHCLDLIHRVTLIKHMFEGQYGLSKIEEVLSEPEYLPVWNVRASNPIDVFGVEYFGLFLFIPRMITDIMMSDENSDEMHLKVKMIRGDLMEEISNLEKIFFNVHQMMRFKPKVKEGYELVDLIDDEFMEDEKSEDDTNE